MKNEISGLGTDIVEIDRIRNAMSEFQDRFLDKLFTLKEQEYCLKYKDPAVHFAGRFAAKEAIAKALGHGFGKHLSFLDIEILPDSSGKPVVSHPEKFGVSHILLSISHCKTVAMATAICMKI